MYPERNPSLQVQRLDEESMGGASVHDIVSTKPSSPPSPYTQPIRSIRSRIRESGVSSIRIRYILSLCRVSGPSWD